MADSVEGSVAKLRFDISMSLDGYVAGPDQSIDEPLGVGGRQLHEWAYGLSTWRASHGQEGGETGVDDEAFRESLENIGATIMGRGMFGPGHGAWGEEPWEGWWGEVPPFGTPVFVLTHHPRETLVKGKTSFEFVTDGIHPALERASEAAGGADVKLGGGADVAQQYLAAGLVDEMQIHLIPVFLGGGARLLDGAGLEGIGLERRRVVDSPTGVVHLHFRTAGERGR